MNANEENIYAVLHEFRNWNREWNDTIKNNPKSVDDFVIELAKTWKVNKKLHMNNQDFKWDDSLVKEIVTNALDLMHETTKHDCSQDYIEKFKASKQIPLEYKIRSIYIDQTPMFPIKPIYPIFGMIRFLIGGKIEYAQTIDDCLNKNECVKIFSVKRISDNCIFSIGDETEQGKIEKFLLAYEELLVFISGHQLPTEFKNLQKAIPKQQILTTEDKVEIFEDDCFWLVFIAPTFGLPSKQRAVKGFVFYEYMKAFSTEEKAQEYHNLYRPCLSVQNVLDNIHDFISLGQLNEISKSLIELAKSKNK